MRISDWSSDVCSSDLVPDQSVRADVRRDYRVQLAARGQGWCRAGRKSLSGEPCRLHDPRSEERRVGKECVRRVDLGGRRIIKKKNKKVSHVMRCTTRLQYK